MPIIKSSSIDEVKSRVGIYELVSNYVSLKKAGTNRYKGLSPFTTEKTPSFFINTTKNFYHCFSTNQGGDIFKFVQNLHSVSFPESVEIIADKFSVKLEYENTKNGIKPSFKKQIFDLYELATNYYAQEFLAETPQAQKIRQYWKEDRAFKAETAKDLRIGYAPTNSDNLKKLIFNGDFDIEAIRQSKLFFCKENETNPARFKPCFNGRLVIPISDLQGRVIAFTARKTEFTPQNVYEEGKYVNSLESLIFKKSLSLYNIDKAYKFAEEKKYFILVEGQLDTIRMYESGFLNTVASQGTAATLMHLKLMKRYVNKLVILFDADRAGKAAALKLIPLCFEAQIEPFIVNLPNDEDPDTIIKKQGKEYMQELIQAHKESAIKFAIRSILPENHTPQEKNDALKKLFEIIEVSNTQTLKDDYLREISLNLKIDLRSLSKDYYEYTKNKNTNKAYESQESAEIKKYEQISSATLDILVLSLNFEEIAAALSKIISPEWIVGETLYDVVLSKILAAYREEMDFSIANLDEFFDSDEEKNLIYAISAEDKSSLEDPKVLANLASEKLYKNYINTKIKEEELLLSKEENQIQKIKILKNVNKLRKELKLKISSIV